MSYPNKKFLRRRKKQRLSEKMKSNLTRNHRDPMRTVFSTENKGNRNVKCVNTQPKKKKIMFDVNQVVDIINTTPHSCIYTHWYCLSDSVNFFLCCMRTVRYDNCMYYFMSEGVQFNNTHMYACVCVYMCVCLLFVFVLVRNRFAL